MRNRLIRGIAALAGALALGAGGAALAQADTSPQPGDIDADKPGSLTIHKYLGDVTGDANNGTKLEPPLGLPPGTNIEFEVYRVGTQSDDTCNLIDLATPAGWEAAQEAIDAQGDGKSPNYCYEPLDDSPYTTDGSGVIKLEELDVGLYYAEEVFDASNGIIQMAEPFYVTIPFPTDGTWNYDVQVYPKNVEMGDPGKYLEGTPTTLTVGTDIQWKITSEIPEGTTITEAHL